MSWKLSDNKTNELVVNANMKYHCVHFILTSNMFLDIISY